MGLNRNYASRYPSGFNSWTPATNVNPDPKNYKVIKAYEKNDYLILKINYPNCTNFEGQKILVFYGVTMIDLINQHQIDPHFFESKEILSPIARFVPTEEGWNMAMTFVDAVSSPK